MPKKSDRPDHGSAMSNLMPDVSLEDEEGGESRRKEDESKSTEEDQKVSTSEENTDAVEERSVESDSGPSKSDAELVVYPSQSPDLSEKLGLLVSKEVEELLDEAYLSMRIEHGKKAKKSLIVEAALRFILNDYQEKGATNSEISQWMKRLGG